MSDDSDVLADKNDNSMAFSASMRSGSGSSVYDILDHKELSQDDLDVEVDLQVAYNKLFK